MGSTTYGTMNNFKGGVAKVTCRTFEAMGQIPMFHRTYFLLVLISLLIILCHNIIRAYFVHIVCVCFVLHASVDKFHRISVFALCSKQMNDDC